MTRARGRSRMRSSTDELPAAVPGPRRSPLTSVERAREIVVDAARALPAGSVGLSDALGLVLAEDLVAALAVPGFDNATMDGYAVRAVDTANATAASPVRLRLAGESRAGLPAASALGKGEAFAISTGAAMPGGADAVVPVEEVGAGDGDVSFAEPVVAGRYVRGVGEDVRAGERLVERGVTLGPAELGVIASQGVSAVSCHRRPRVAVLTCGDELTAPGVELGLGAIHDSNAASVGALVASSGAELAGVARSPDRRTQTTEAIASALEADIAVVCGGVSVGEHDHVKASFEELGVQRAFWGVALRPGKPTWFGTRGSTLAFGLPGNPVSAMVTFLLLVRPALAALAGARADRDRTTAILDADYEKTPGRTHAIRCRLSLADDGWHALPAPRQASHILTSMLGADCLAIAPAESAGLYAGDRVEIELLGRGGAS